MYQMCAWGLERKDGIKKLFVNTSQSNDANMQETIMGRSGNYVLSEINMFNKDWKIKRTIKGFFMCCAHLE